MWPRGFQQSPVWIARVRGCSWPSHQKVTDLPVMSSPLQISSQFWPLKHFVTVSSPAEFWVTLTSTFSSNLLPDNFTACPSLHLSNTIHSFSPFLFLPFLSLCFPIYSCYFQSFRVEDFRWPKSSSLSFFASYVLYPGCVTPGFYSGT